MDFERGYAFAMIVLGAIFLLVLRLIMRERQKNAVQLPTPPTTVSATAAFNARVPSFSAHYFTVPAKYVMDVKQTVADMTWELRSTEPLVHIGAKRAAKLMGKREGTMIYPQEWTGDPLDTISMYLPPDLQKLFDQPVQFGIDDETRYMHHHCLGAFGSGKTTYLSHYILKDLERAVAGEASLVVMDSQRLIQQILRTRLFAPGGPLYDKVVVIDNDKHYPVALNPFALGQRTGEAMLSYAFAGMTETTDQTEDALKWVIRAAACVAGANFDTLVQILRPQKGEWRFPFEAVFDQPTRDYFDFVFPKLPGATKSAALRRLYSFQQNEALARMLNADTCRLDFFEEFSQGGKVILIDTNRADLGKDGCEAFGRLFIFLLDQMAAKRGKYDEHTLKPVFVVIDEVHDYIAHDPVFADMIFKARNKRVALTLAHHDWEQIKNANTAVGLKQTAIHSQCTKRGLPAQVRIEDKNYLIPFEKLEWDKLPQMTNAEYHQLRQHIFSKYGATYKPPAAPDVPLVD